jgi:hypothetical protein
MGERAFPVGTPRPYDCSKGLEGLDIGFAEVEFTAPADLKIPVLGVKAYINGSEKLIFPTGGPIRGVFYSEELKYAQSLGYKIKLIKALSFEKSYDLFQNTFLISIRKRLKVLGR